jgi:hypothetical protein
MDIWRISYYFDRSPEAKDDAMQVRGFVVPASLPSTAAGLAYKLPRT